MGLAISSALKVTRSLVSSYCAMGAPPQWMVEALIVGLPGEDVQCSRKRRFIIEE